MDNGGQMENVSNVPRVICHRSINNSILLAMCIYAYINDDDDDDDDDRNKNERPTTTITLTKSFIDIESALCSWVCR